jgi:hypothetical protein
MSIDATVSDRATHVVIDGKKYAVDFVRAALAAPLPAAKAS